MRRRSRRHDLLQEYGLEASSSVRLAARSEQHDSARMRMRAEDVQSLRSQPGAMSSPVIALFSTRNPREPVSFRPSETLYVRLPANTAEDIDESDKDKREDTEQPSDKQSDKPSDKASDNPSDKASDKHLDTEQPKQAEQTKYEQKQHRRRRAQSPWTPLRLVAYHSYVVGMRVSGIVHRAIVRLEFDK